MSEDTDVIEGNKRNIIVGYKTLEDIQVKLARVETLLEANAVAQERDRNEGTARHADHELRLRVLELTVGSGKDTQQATKNIWVFVWGAVIALPGFFGAIIGLIRLLKGLP